MPQEKPVHNSLSRPVEPQFLTVLERTVQDSFEYGVNKYGTELHSFNGRSELQDLAEELVSALRYATQLDMRCQVLEGLLREVRKFCGGDWYYASYDLKQRVDNAIGKQS